MDEYMAKISFFGFNWCPRNYMFCQGQLVAIAENTALYSLLGTNFGGDSRSTFGLPDLRGKVMMGQGSPQHPFGSMGGNETTTLSVRNLPQHTHDASLTFANNSVTIKASADDGKSNTPGGKNKTLCAIADNAAKIYGQGTPDVDLNIGDNNITGAVTVNPAGSSQYFSNMQPYLVLNPCILTQGIFPSRN